MREVVNAGVEETVGQPSPPTKGVGLHPSSFYNSRITPHTFLFATPPSLAIFHLSPSPRHGSKGIQVQENGSARPPSQEPFLPFEDAGGGLGLEQLVGYVADESNENGPTILAHAHEDTGRAARDARAFFYFFVAEMVPPMSLFLHRC
jgi:hypothetical protein